MNEDPMRGIRAITIQRHSNGSLGKVRIVFGPHHFIELHSDAEGRVEFWLGATHHGIRADASEVNSQLERMVEFTRKQFPENTLDSTPLWDGQSRTIY
jgi:hypothetical protein